MLPGPGSTSRTVGKTIEPSVAERAASWSRYWQQGHLHSCGTSFDGNYAGEVRAFWARAADGLAPAAQVLDLCSGNGALPRLLLELRPDAPPRIDAVDLAAIAPDWLGRLPPAQQANVRFHAGTAVERLPLSDRSVDLAVSQFGLEYADGPAALQELRRVLRPGGRVALIVHADDSLIARHAREELGHLDWLVDAAALPALAERMLGPVSQSTTAAGRATLQADPEANALRRRFNEALQALERRAAGSTCPDLLFEAQREIAAALQAAARAAAVPAGQDRLQLLSALLDDRRLQLGELLACARDRDAAAAMLAPLAPLGLNVAELRFDGGEQLGWGIEARLPG